LKTDVIKKRNRGGYTSNSNTSVGGNSAFGRGGKNKGLSSLQHTIINNGNSMAGGTTMGVIGKRSNNDGNITIAPNPATMMNSVTETTSGGGSGGRPITFAPSRWGDETLNKRQRRHSLTDKNITPTNSGTNEDQVNTQPAMVISGSLPNQSTSSDGFRQVLLSKQQHRHGSLSINKPTTDGYPKDTRPILPNNQRVSLQSIASAPNLSWMGLLAQQQQQQQHQQHQQQQQQHQQQQQQHNNPFSTPINNNLLSTLTPAQLKQLILFKQAAIQASSATNSNENSSMDHDHGF
jgi:hypothetical protein